MTPRSIRRAAERKARKLARKAEKQSLLQTAEAVSEPEMPFPALEPELERAAPAPKPLLPADEAAPLSEPKTEKTPSPARLAANQANAQLATGHAAPQEKRSPA